MIQALSPWCALVLLLIHTASTTEYFLKSAQSFIKPYSSHWVSYGTAFITQDYARLTSATPSSQGGIYNNIAMPCRDWEVHITFRVHGPRSHLFGDGFAFWYTQDHLALGSAFGSREVFRGLGVFFDTYNNHNGEHNHDHPYISAMVNDGTKVYDHDRDGTLTELSGCTCYFRDKPHNAVAAIRYSNNVLTVSTSIDGTDNWVNCFVVEDVRLPVGYFLGVSAATGDLYDNHDIISIKTYELDVDRSTDPADFDAAQVVPSAAKEAPVRDRVADLPQAHKAWSIFWRFLYWLFILGLLVGVGFIAYTWYRSRERQRKRFY